MEILPSRYEERSEWNEREGLKAVSRNGSERKRGRFMCDYSLMMIPNRLAIEGEELVAHRFQSGSLGLVSCFDYESWLNQRSRTIWQKFKAWCQSDGEPAPVVCIPPGARLRLDGLPEILKDHFDLSSWEEATFAQLSAEVNQHRDALCFDNGAIVSLELLPEGQKTKILRLCSQEDVESDPDRLRIARLG